MEVNFSIFVELAKELSDLCGEGDKSLRGWLGVILVVVGFFVGVVVVGGQNGWFAGGDDVKGVTCC